MPLPTTQPFPRWSGCADARKSCLITAHSPHFGGDMTLICCNELPQLAMVDFTSF